MMSRHGMLRTRRRDVNVKPNRRLDRKSSRGMIYENEELRLRTININAEIERGQSDIKKLRRENEQLRKEIWCLRDEYEKLDKLLKEKEHDGSSCTSCTSDSESCSSATETSENEASQNLENVQKTNMHSLRQDFDHLSIVTEETSAECSDKNSNSLPKETNWNILPPDQSYPINGVNPIPPHVKHFFSPIKTYESSGWPRVDYPQGVTPMLGLTPCEKTSSDLIVKTDSFPNFSQESQGTNSFVNGGNLEELLQDIDTISKDILQISDDVKKQNFDDKNKPYKTEINVVLMPKPMDLLGDELQTNIENLKKSTEDMANLENLIQENNMEKEQSLMDLPMMDMDKNERVGDIGKGWGGERSLGWIDGKDPWVGNNDEWGEDKNEDWGGDMNQLEMSKNSIDHPKDSKKSKYDEKFPTCMLPKKDLSKIGTKIDEPFPIFEPNVRIEDRSIDLHDYPIPPPPAPPQDYFDNLNYKNEEKANKMNEIEEKGKTEAKKSEEKKKTRKVSIYFKGKKDKLAVPEKKPEQKSPLPEKKVLEPPPIPKVESKTSIYDKNDSDKIINSDAKTSSDSRSDRKHRKSSSTSPERKHTHKDTLKKQHKKRHKKSDRPPVALRRHSISVDRSRDNRSFSICTDRSHILDRYGSGTGNFFEDYTNSERERTNSLSSCDTSRKNSIINLPTGGKIPWFGCWGNGCI